MISRKRVWQLENVSLFERESWKSYKADGIYGSFYYCAERRTYRCFVQVQSSILT